MDEELTAGYSEPCAQCSAVDWGVSEEGRFYCRSCHNVSERTREVVDPYLSPGSSRISSISSASRSKHRERGRQWMICEGFQMILRMQADALVTLGVSTHFRDQVLCQMWRLYLQKSQQAYTNTPIRTTHLSVRGVDSDSGGVSSGLSASDTDGETNQSSLGGGAHTGSSSDWSLYSGSVDAHSYLSAGRRRSLNLMSMRKTLALIHLALVWSRQALTLSDLLRLVAEGSVPYVAAYEGLPVEMMLEGKDVLLFRVESVPSHRTLHKEAETLLHFLQLPAFPPISRGSPLHPALLSLRYLRDANLPDELHPSVCRLMECAGMADAALLTCASSPPRGTAVPRYDMQSAALVIVTVKMLFGMDDATEWELSNQTPERHHSGERFSLRRWYRLVQTALIRARGRRRDQDAGRQWKPDRPLHLDRKHQKVVAKRKRVAEQLQLCFSRLSSANPGGLQRPAAPSTFRFQWGEGQGEGGGADGPSMHQEKLPAWVGPAPQYWRPARTGQVRSRRQYVQLEASLARSFVWLLRLFGFLLGVTADYLYEELRRVEAQVLSGWRGTRRRSPRC
ncbi:TATA box-binding protein-associated factor RNA polymerase I subunit B isoform X2 [Nelusetta ayraudi]|uniref:TATA box-binding protein-associated factor RNA polymerase I subunit B isoform X2 n=1 Tax=Nelusetta ayraudi TaxID=303726 RepID=UPI003F724556